MQSIRSTRTASTVPCSRAGGSHRRVWMAASRNNISPFSHLSCPYEVLGLPQTADEGEIKKQYRMLAKKYHPDASKDANSTPQFLNITQAYEFLLMQLRHKNVDENGNPKPGNSDAFHDWYWSFRMSRNWERQQQGKGVEGPANATSAAPQSAEGLRSQLAGLRHRAAIRKQKAATTAADTSDGDQEQVQQEEHQQGQVVPEPVVYAAAEGPSDSADPAAAVPPETADDSAAAGATQAAGAPRRKFVAGTEVREGLKQQLHGMRRKAALKREINATQPAHSAA